MAKRGNNEGSIYKDKQGRWRGVVTIYTAELAKIAANLCDIALHLSDFSDEEDSSDEHYEDD